MPNGYTVKVAINEAALRLLLHTARAQALLTKCADAALEAQKSFVPVDTGNLKSKLAVEVTNAGLSRNIGILAKDPVDYALPVELGHQTRGGSFVKAQPFIRPSIDVAKKGLL